MIDKNKLARILEKRKLKEYEEDILSELNDVVGKTLDMKSKEIKNKKRIIANDNAKEHISAKKIFTQKEIDKLPTWVKRDIDKSQIVGRSKKVIQVSNGRKYHTDNKLNDLSGAEWTFFLNSVINTRRRGGNYGKGYRSQKLTMFINNGWIDREIERVA